MDGFGIGARSIDEGVGRDTFFNTRVEPQMRIMERLGEMTAAAHLENLRCPLVAYGREICLRFHSKGDCVKSCTRSHAPLRDIVRKFCYATSGFEGLPLNPQRRESLTGEEIGDPTEETGTGT